MSGTNTNSENSDFTFNFSTFLPAVNQTDTLIKFFGATVDQLFQPGVSKSLSGYIGQVPLYNNYLTDFYIQEPDAERSAYQLEATMVSFSQTTTSAPTIANALTYPDFVGYLNNSSAITTIQPRLFENNYFTWAPPVDIDKLLNYSEYCWVGAVNAGSVLSNASLPALNISSPVAVYSATASQQSFAATGKIPGLPIRASAYVNGLHVIGSYNQYTDMYTISSPINAYDSVVITLYDQLEDILPGLINLDLSALSNYYVEYTGDGFTTQFNAFNNVTVSGNATVIAVYLNGVLQGYLNQSGFTGTGFTIDSSVNPPVVIFSSAPDQQTSSAAADVVTIVTYTGMNAVLNQTPPNNLDTTGIAIVQPALTCGLICTINDCHSIYYDEPVGTYFVDGVGLSTRLTNIDTMTFVPTPQYQTIDRSSVDQNAWSLHNFWVHVDSFAWAGNAAISYTTASRPIIEFVRDIVLYNYGSQRIVIDALMTQQTATLLVGGVSSQISLGQINLKRFGTVAVDNGSVFTPANMNTSEQMNGNDVVNAPDDAFELGDLEDQTGIENIYGDSVNENLAGYDSSDLTGVNGLFLRPGMTLLVINETVNQLFTVTDNGSDQIILVPVTTSVQGQYFTTPQFSVFGGQDIHYDAETLQWIIGGYQEWSESVAPLFYLYNADATGVPLDNPSMYTGSNFAGSEIFAYATGTGSIDPVLLQPLQYDSNGYIVFENLTVTERYTYNGGAISGLYCYGLYIKEIEGSIAEGGSAADLCDAYTGALLQQRMNDEQNSIVFNFDPTLVFKMPTDEIDAENIPEIMNGTDYVDSIQVQNPDDISYFYKTVSLWLPAPNLSIQVTGSSYPAVPPNLQANPLTEDVSYISLSDWYLHFTEILQNQTGFTGNTYAANNYRDTSRNLALGTEIVQHQAPMTKTMLLSSSEQFDVPNAIRFAENEYKKFKNKFALKIVSIRNRGVLDNGITDLTVNPNDPASWAVTPLTWVTTALNEIKANFNSSFPFALSTMAGGNYYIPPTPAFLGVMPPTSPEFIVDTTYSQQKCFIRGHDGSYLPAFGTFTSTPNGYVSSDWRDPIFLALETLIYQNIPSVANASDLSNFIQERLNFDVFQWMNNPFYTVPLSNGYARTEINSILSSSFEQWAQQGKFDYRTYGGYDQNNPFTWNYSSSLDCFGNPLPGNWRGIYNYYYDTDCPHTRPWEMLGFAEMPVWWEDVYGTNYGASNTILWQNLEDGFVAEGPRLGINPRYARPGLSRLLPVDAYGNLLDPISIGIVPTPPPQYNATQDWTFGDWGPVETLWRKSSSYKFALSELGFLIKPPRFTEICWDTVNYNFSGEQWVNLKASYPNNTSYLNRPSSSSSTDLVHGEIDTNGNSVVVVGIQQWIVDGLINIGQTASVLGSAIRNIDVRLAHRMAGFVSTDGLTAVSDTFGLLPSEDVQIALYNCPAFDTETYTGVIVEWSGNGYRVTGYDSQNPYFTIFPPNTASAKSIISIATSVEQTPYVWRPNTYYTVGVNVLYNGYIYRCTSSNTSGSTFDLTYWTQLGAQAPVAPRVNSYAKYQTTAVQIPYSTVLPTLQSVADFLLGLQAWQVSRGWVFNQIEKSSGLNNDWFLAVKEFLEWSQVSWAPGNFIALSPGAEILNFVSSYGTILNVEDPVTGFFGLVDRSGNPINSKGAYVSRFGSQITLQCTNADIYGCRLRIAEVEHLLVFSNTTIFDDLLYIPLFNMRQARLLLTANVSTNWNGRLSAPGFVLVSNDLVPNFDKNAEDIRTMFDIEKTDRTDFLAYARHNIGYQARSYMEDLLLSSTEQFEFFQGMIQAKGSPSVFERLLRSTRINENSDIEFLEEWAVRQSHYGAPINPRITLTLPQNDVRADPQLIIFTQIENASPIWIQVPLDDSRWLDAPPTQQFFPISTKPPVLPSAGPVRLSEVQYTSFYTSDLETYFTNAYDNNLSVFNTGERVWIYNNNNNWDVWRVFDIGMGNLPNTVTEVSTPSDDPTVTGMRIYFELPLTINENDIGSYLLIDGSTLSTPDLIGIQVITAFDLGDQWIEVDQTGSTGYTFTGTATPPTARIFRSVRFATTNDLYNTIIYEIAEIGNVNDSTNTYTFDALDDGTYEVMNTSDASDISSNLNTSYWIVGDIVYVDNAGNTGLYAVYQWDGMNFNLIRSQPARIDAGSIVDSTIYEAGSYIVNSADFTGQQSTQNAQLVSDNPLVDDMTVVDPIAGFIPGLAEREITYRTDVDPANYNSVYAASTSVNPWGADQVGQVWWNLATCRYLEPYTDNLGVTNERDITEITYRCQNWAMIAPNSSIDVYEWVQSSVPPSAYSSSGNPGTVYNAETPSFVQQIVYSPQYNTFVTVYYFWVTGLTTVPNVPFRNTDITTVASVLTNPSVSGLPWIAPIMPNGLLVSGVQSYLDNISSTMMVEISSGTDEKTHAEWILIDQNDSLSLPPKWLSRKMRDSLGGFQDNLTILPNPSLSSYRSTGIYDGQNMFTTGDETSNPPQGILDARQSYVGIINNILARSPVSSINASGVAALNRSDTSVSTLNQYLFWTRPDDTWPIIPPPSNQYSVTVYSSDQRNLLLLTPDFQTALANNSGNINVLIDGTNTSYPFWSIWEFNPQQANMFLQSMPPGTDPTTYLYDNAEQIFSLATAYDAVASSYANMIAGSLVSGTLEYGTRIFVQSDENADGFWTIYTYNGNSYILLRSQLFRTNDFIEVVNWYAQDITINNGNTVSYSSTNPPTVTYISTGARDQAEGTTNSYTLPQNTFVSVSNSASQFTWYAFDTTVVGTTTINNVSYNVYGGWTIVATSNGTIALTDAFYTKFDINNNYFDRFVYGLSLPPVLYENLSVNGVVTPIPTIINRDGSWEIRVLFDALNANVLSDAQINEVFFSMVHFIHTQQNSVDWIFKTSFMTIGGFAIPLGQTGILLPDPTNDLVNYVDEVKPYRVKIRDYSQQYSLNMDQADVTVTDFDLPSYLNTITNTNDSIYAIITYTQETIDGITTEVPSANFIDQYGNTLPTLPTQLTQYPWEYWYQNFLTSDNVRSMNIKVLFDRVVAAGYAGYDVPPYSTQGYDDGDEYSVIIVFPPWQAGVQYNVNDPVSYNGNNYICSVANNSTIFLTSDWTLQVDEAANQTAAYRIANYYNGTAINNVLTFSYGTPDPMNVRQKGNEIDANLTVVGDFDDAPFDSQGFDLTETLTQTSIIDGGSFPWISGKHYHVGDVVTYQNAEYQCIYATNATTFNEVDWNLVGNVTLSINAPTSDSNRAISDTETIALPNSTNVTLPLGGVADPLGYGFRDPYIDANVPEERIPLIIDDTILLNVTSKPLAGAVVRSAKVYDISQSNNVAPMTYDLGIIPESNQSVLVFRDGLLSNFSTDYTIDQLGRTVTVNVVDGASKYKTIHVHAIGVGANKPLLGEFFFSAPTNTTRTYELPLTTTINNSSQLTAVVGGIRNYAWVLGSDQKSIVFNTAPSANADVVVRVYPGVATSEATTINVQNLTYNAQQSWDIIGDYQIVPEYAETMVFVNGKQIMPPLMFRGAFTNSSSAIPIEYSVTTSTMVTVYYIPQGMPWVKNTSYDYGDVVLYEGVNYVCITPNSSPFFDVDNWELETPMLYVNVIPIVTSLNQTVEPIDEPHFAFYNNTLVSLNSSFVSPNVCLVITEGNQYTLNGAVLKITTELSVDDEIKVLNFQNSAMLQTQMYTYQVNDAGQYPLISMPVTNEYALVTFNGLMLSPDADYQFMLDENNNPFMNAPGLSGSGYLVITLYPGIPYRGTINWLSATDTPSAIRMMPQQWNNLTTAEQGSMGETFTYSGDFNNYLSLIPLGNITPNENTVYSITVNGVAYTDTVPIYDTSQNNYPTKQDGAADDPQFIFFGSSLMSLNYNFVANASTNGGTSPAVVVELQDIPVPIFANLNGFAGLIPYYPQDTNPYDHAVINQEGVPQPAFVYTMAKWDNISANIISTATLANDLLVTDSTIILNLNQANISPKIGLQYPFFVPTSLIPGVIFVNGERIEYRTITYGNYISVPGYPMVPTTAVLGNLRRATQGTIIPENRIITTSPYPLTAPYQGTFVLESSSSNLIMNGNIQVMTQNLTTGKNTIVSGYGVERPTTNSIIINLLDATDEFYIVSVTLPLSHSVGSTVYNGNLKFPGDVPVGPDIGNRYVVPVSNLVNNW